MSEAAQFICHGCGGTMEFDIAKQKFLCPNCGAESDDIAGDGDVREYDFTEAETRKARTNTDWTAGRHGLHCAACGADIVVDTAVTSVSCPYCGSSHVLEAKQNDGIPPEGIVPFLVDKNKAGGIFRKWAGSRFWAPNAFKRLYQQNKLQAVYHPYWTFDAHTYTSYSAEGGKVYYVTVGSGKNKRTERRVRWYPVRGTWQKFFDDVLVDAAAEHNKLVSKISQYDTTQTAPFATAYLSGYAAERYTRAPTDCFGDAQQFMEQQIQDEITSHILSRYDEVRGVRTNVEYSGVKFKHVLLPVWSGGLNYGGKVFNIAINGQSGRIAGEYPKSIPKIAAAVVLGLAVLTAAIYVLSNYVQF